VAVYAAVVLILCAMASSAAVPGRQPAEGKIVRLTLPVEGKQITGEIITYDSLLFTLGTESGELIDVLWDSIPAANVDRYWRYLEEPDGDPAKLFELGALLARHPQGKTLSEKAFASALELDAGLADKIEAARSDADASPRHVGQADPARWGPQSDQAMQDATNQIIDFCKRAQESLQLELNLYQSDRFIILTDADEDEVRSVTQKLVEGYRASAELLGEDPDANAFMGKCLVVLLKKRVDYMRFQQQMHDTDARGTGGLCHGFGDGQTHVALYSRGNPRQTSHIAVHELVHAFLHRYQAPHPLPDWVDEGLAEHLAHQIEPAPGSNPMLKTRLLLEGKKGLGEGFYDGEKLASWQYDTAGALTGFLIERSRLAYPKMIRSLKQGDDTRKALETVYRMSPELLTQRFKQRLDRELTTKLGE